MGTTRKSQILTRKLLITHGLTISRNPPLSVSLDHLFHTRALSVGRSDIPTAVALQFRQSSPIESDPVHSIQIQLTMRTSLPVMTPSALLGFVSFPYVLFCLALFYLMKERTNYQNFESSYPHPLKWLDFLWYSSFAARNAEKIFWDSSLALLVLA